MELIPLEDEQIVSIIKALVLLERMHMELQLVIYVVQESIIIKSDKHLKLAVKVAVQYQERMHNLEAHLAKTVKLDHI